MLLAVISDIHGNDAALQAVLTDIDNAGADGLVCLGDVATLGPNPTSTIERLRDLRCPCIMGNHDEFLLDAALVYRYTEDPLIAASVDWCRAQLSRDDLDFIRGFERRMRMELAPGVSALLYHGSPASHLDDLLATTSPEELDRLMSGHVADIMVGGHTHVQMVRQHHGSLLLNPGSVGLAFKDFPEGREPTLLTHAEYALARADEKGISVTVRRVAFDVKAHREAIACTDHPMRDWLLGQYR